MPNQKAKYIISIYLIGKYGRLYFNSYYRFKRVNLKKLTDGSYSLAQTF